MTLQSSLSWNHNGNTASWAKLGTRCCRGRFVVTLAVTSYRNLNVTSKCQRSLRDIAVNDNKNKKNLSGFNKNGNPGARYRKATVSLEPVRSSSRVSHASLPAPPCVSACLCVCTAVRLGFGLMRTRLHTGSLFFPQGQD